MLLPHARKSHVKPRLVLRALFTALTLLPCLVTASAVGAAPQKPVKATAPAAPTTLNSTAVWPRFGLDFSSSTGGGALNVGHDVGAGLARVWWGWADIEPLNTTPDNYDWAGSDATFAAVIAAGMQPSVLIYKCPAWACPYGNGPINRVQLTEFAEFTTALVHRYSVAPYNIHLWEFFNEPDGMGRPQTELNWGAHGADYAAMLQAVVPRMRAIDPQVKIVLGGLAYDWFSDDPYPGPFRRSFLPDVLTAGGGPYIDYLTFHHYMANIHWPTIIDKVAELKQLAASYGFSGQIVCNETGFSSSSELSTARWGPNSPEIQARYLSQIFVQSAAAGTPGLVWFSTVDTVGEGPFASFTKNGLITVEGARKPAFYAFQTAAQELGDSAYLRRFSDAELGTSGVEAYLFAGANPARPVSVMWSSTAEPRMVHLPQADVVRLLNMTGQQISGTPDGRGGLNVNLGENPVYVEWSHPPRFTDVARDFFLYDSIEYLAQHGAISGYADGTFRPFSTATRGQITKIIALANNWTLSTTGGPHFRDVPAQNPFYQFIETAYSKGVISGYADGTFQWGNAITRGQLSKVIVLAQGWTPVSNGVAHFRDVPTNNPFFGFIERAFEKGIISGYNLPSGGLEFRWGANATRGQISKIIYVALTNSPAVPVQNKTTDK